MKCNAKTYHWTFSLGLILAIILLLGLKTPASADVNVGDKIDSSNWQKVQGLVPDRVLDYLKKGWIKITIGKLNYNPGDVWFQNEGEKRNKGKYDVTDKGELIDKATKLVDPLDIIGAPFPTSELNTKDPKMAIKWFYNSRLTNTSGGSHRQNAVIGFVGDKLERFVAGPQKGMKFVMSQKNIENQKHAHMFGKGIQEIFVMQVTDPYELNGLATMSYQYLGNTPDKVFSYIPALRRARVLTASARSDSMFGSDYALDDSAGGWAAKPRDFNFKYVRTQEALVQYVSPDRLKFFPNPDGSISMQKTPFVTGQFGFETPGWTGKPWAVTNSIWVKRKVHVFEAVAKDPYYNYGKMEIWGDAETHKCTFKMIYDRAGKFWKIMIMNSGSRVAPEGYPWGTGVTAFGDMIYDEQRNHATTVMELKPGRQKDFNVTFDPAEFTLLGFTKISK